MYKNYKRHGHSNDDKVRGDKFREDFNLVVQTAKDGITLVTSYVAVTKISKFKNNLHSHIRPRKKDTYGIHNNVIGIKTTFRLRLKFSQLKCHKKRQLFGCPF